MFSPTSVANEAMECISPEPLMWLQTNAVKQVGKPNHTLQNIFKISCNRVKWLVLMCYINKCFHYFLDDTNISLKSLYNAVRLNSSTEFSQHLSENKNEIISMLENLQNVALGSFSLAYLTD